MKQQETNKKLTIALQVSGEQKETETSQFQEFLSPKPKTFSVLKNKALIVRSNYTVYAAHLGEANFVAKVFQKAKIDTNLEKRLILQLKLRKRLKHHNFLKLQYCYENKEELVLVFEHFESVFQYTEDLSQFQKKKMLAQLLLGMIEINQLGYSLGCVDMDSIVYLKGNNYKFFLFDFVTNHGDKANEYQQIPEHWNFAEEFEKGWIVTDRTDSWLMGILMICVLAGKKSFSPNMDKLETEPSEEVEKLLGNGVKGQGLLSMLIGKLFGFDQYSRLTLLELSSSFYFSPLFRKNKETLSFIPHPLNLILGIKITVRKRASLCNQTHYSLNQNSVRLRNKMNKGKSGYMKRGSLTPTSATHHTAADFSNWKRKKQIQEMFRMRETQTNRRNSVRESSASRSPQKSQFYNSSHNSELDILGKTSTARLRRKIKRAGENNEARRGDDDEKTGTCGGIWSMLGCV